MAVSPAIYVLILFLNCILTTGRKYLPSATKRVNIIPGNKDAKEKRVDALFAGDNEAFVFKAIREEKSSNYPKIKISIPKDTIILKTRLIPDKFEIRNVKEGEYKKITSKCYYPRIIGKKPNCSK